MGAPSGRGSLCLHLSNAFNISSALCKKQRCIKQHTSTKIQRYWNTNNRAWEKTIVLPVHCKDKIEVTEIWGFDRSGYWGHLNPPLLWSWSHPWVCLVTLNPQNTLSVMPLPNWVSKVNAGDHLMVSYGTSRVYLKLGVKPTLAYDIPENSLSCRTPANVPCTNSSHQTLKKGQIHMYQYLRHLCTVTRNQPR